jgi:hypothetical protein
VLYSRRASASSLVLLLSVALFMLIHPARAAAQSRETRAAWAIWGVGVQMGGAHCAAANGDRVNLIRSITYLLDAMRDAPGCFDPEPWTDILRRVQAGADPRSVFNEIRALIEMPDATVLQALGRCPCSAGATVQPPPPPPPPPGNCDQPLSCAYCLGEGIRNKWLSTGGESGPLNCPVMNEADARRSPQGTTGRYAQFRGGDGGYIFWHGSGGRRGNAYVVRGCMFKLYASRGNSGSALGFPLGDEYAVSGGARQDFEGGSIVWDARTGGCQEAGRTVEASLSGLRWEIPCRSAGDRDCSSPDPAPVTAEMGGEPGAVYDVTLRFRGVVEQKTYQGGSNDGAYWQVGGEPANDPYNIYKLEVSNPARVYYLNRGASGGDPTWLIDYAKTIRIATGARVVLSASVIDGAERTNHDLSGRPILVPGVAPYPAAFNGQFIQMDVIMATLVR